MSESRVVISKDASPSEILDALDKYFYTHRRHYGGPATQLWNILSAFRGPDMPGSDEQKQLTVTVRILALPRSAKMYSFPLEHHRNVETLLQLTAPLEDHFHSHINAAAYALSELGRAEVKSNA